MCPKMATLVFPGKEGGFGPSLLIKDKKQIILFLQPRHNRSPSQTAPKPQPLPSTKTFSTTKISMNSTKISKIWRSKMQKRTAATTTMKSSKNSKSDFCRFILKDFFLLSYERSEEAMSIDRVRCWESDSKLTLRRTSRSPPLAGNPKNYHLLKLWIRT